VSSLAEPGWEAVARDPRFIALVSERRRFVVRATVFYCIYLLAYLVLLGVAKDFMAKEVVGSISLAVLGGLSICVLAVVMAALYVRRSERWDRMADEVRR
jgi:uncharacterized membrane protein (DUF485 family)